MLADGFGVQACTAALAPLFHLLVRSFPAAVAVLHVSLICYADMKGTIGYLLDPVAQTLQTAQGVLAIPGELSSM